MARISGAKTNAGYKIATTYGTAVQAAAGQKLLAEISPNFNVEELIPRMIGSGVSMVNTATRGNLKPQIDITMDARYRDCMAFILAQFMGTSGAPVEQTGGQADYKHTITFNTTMNAKYGTLAYESSSATVIEYPSVATSEITFSLDDAPGILEFTASLLANNAVITGTVNTNASLASATLVDTETINYAFEDTFRQNAASGGSLAGGDQYNIVSYELNLQRPQEFIGEIKSTVGNGEPIETDLFAGTLTLGVKSLEDHTRLTEWSAETPQKCALNIQGTQIGSGVNKGINILIPRMLLVQEPQYQLTSAGINPLTLTYRILQASANPTGMTSTLPYFEIINGLSTSLLA